MTINTYNSAHLKSLEFLGACADGKIEAVKTYINEGIDVNFQNEYGDAALLYVMRFALYDTNRDLLKHLISEDANLDIQNNKGQTALIQAAGDGDIEACKLLLDNNANPNIENKDGKTALFLASFSWYKEVVELLINRGANIDHRDKLGKTTLIYMAQRGQKDFVSLLINKKANPNIQDNEGDTAIIKAINNIDLPYHNIIKELIDYKADILIKNNNNKTVLDISIDKNDYVSIVLLKKELINSKDETGSTYLMKACQDKDAHTALFLAKNGADFFIENDKGDSAYKILKRKRSLPEKLQALKENIVLKQSINEDNDISVGL